MYILIAVIALVALPFIVALFVKKEYTLERSIVIDKPNQEVFNYLRHLKNQDYYSKWIMVDPAMKKEFKGIDGKTGFVYAWDSENKNAGKGEQEIKEIVEGKKIEVEVRFEKPFEGVAIAPILTEAISSDQTEVRWGMSGKSKYPMNLANLFMNKMLGKDLQASLGTLKSVLEKN